MNFGSSLLQWYQQHQRDLPWRHTRDPYAIWLSEVILQQTRVAQGLPYYQAFIQSYPSVHHLAAASETEVLKLWQGLGYYSRARNLRSTAQQVVEEYQGQFPNTYEGLLQLKGIGPYTAAAIASLAFDQAVAVVDGNVYRVLGRYDSIDLDTLSPAGQKLYRHLAQSYLDQHPPALFNQAIMELGALVCTPKNPQCDSCPLAEGCTAKASGRMLDYPVKKPKKAARIRHFHYLVLEDVHGRTTMQARPEGDIWTGLYEFPLLERQEPPLQSNWESVLGISLQHYKALPVHHVIHKLTHQHVHLHFWSAYTPQALSQGFHHLKALDLPVPIALHNFMTAYWKGQ